MAIAETVSDLSKDKSTKTASIIIGPDNEIRSVGYNGFTRGANDELAERHERPEKYFWAEHGERNAIYNAARIGIPLNGCTLITWASRPVFICMDCARGIVQSGIIKVIMDQRPDMSIAPWNEHAPRTIQLLKESKVELEFLTDLAKKPVAINTGWIEQLDERYRT